MSILNSCSHIMMLQLRNCLKSLWPYFQLFCHSMSICHIKTLPLSKNSVCQCAVLFGTSLSGCSLLNASQRAVSDFDVKQRSRNENICLWVHHVCTCTDFAKLLRVVTRVILTWVSWGRLEDLLHRGGLASGVIFQLQYMTVGFCFKWYTCMLCWWINILKTTEDTDLPNIYRLWHIIIKCTRRMKIIWITKYISYSNSMSHLITKLY
jgi:hypothetical protein